MTRDGEWLIRMTLAELAPQLDPASFCQIHRSTVVNMNEVAATRRDLSGRVFVRLKDGKTELPVSRAYAHLFKQM
jgi:DNA-binding LytR/AlgR family response regulator